LFPKKGNENENYCPSPVHLEKKHWGSVDRKGVKGNHNMKIVKGASRL